MNEVIGKPADRVDGRLKVTGGAKYAAEFIPPGLAHGVTVQSTISKGTIQNIDIRAAANAPGVLGVITHQNALRLTKPKSGPSSGKLGEKELLPLQDNKIFYDGQHIAVVVAETFEQAEHAASLIKVDYKTEPPVFEIEQAQGDAYQPKDSMGRPLQIKRGDAEKNFQDSPVKISETYSTPVYHHNPMEPHATIAEWIGDKLTIWDSTQGVLATLNVVAGMLDISPEKVHLISPFVGGGFGCKGFTWAQVVLAPMAAKKIGRPVKIVLNRQQMFTCNGHRARTIQQIGLGAAGDGKLAAIRHVTNTETSFVDEFVETAGLATNMLYACPNVTINHNLVKLNKGTPTPMRAPGEATGTFAIESAMDELAWALKLDPIQLRLLNYAETSPSDGKKWSSKNLKECYQRGAEAIGWNLRTPEPRSMRDGNLLVGYGMATATYPANRSPSSAKIQMYDDGRVEATCCTQDIGTGTYTIVCQVAAEILGVPIGRVKSKLGDSYLPPGPLSGGSQTTASVAPAVRAAALKVFNQIARLAVSDEKSPLYGSAIEAITARDGRLFLKTAPDRGETYEEILTRQKLPFVAGEVKVDVSTREGQKKKKPAAKPNETDPVILDEDTDREAYAFHSFGAQFVKVLVDPLLGTVRVARCCGVMDIGRVMNLKTAKNQIMGGMIFGLGMALMEESVYDPNSGRIVTRDLANYLVPVHADMPEFEVQFLDRPDPVISPIGARGIGEIGITGMAAAIANAVYHATGKRIRELPITPDKLLQT